MKAAALSLALHSPDAESQTLNSDAAPTYFSAGSSHSTLKLIHITLSPLRPQHLKLHQLSGLLRQLVQDQVSFCRRKSNSVREARKTDVWISRFRTLPINPAMCLQIPPLKDSVTSTTASCNFPDHYQIISHST